MRVYGWNISCRSCLRTWSLGCSFGDYERQAIESRPCPHCAAYTLACADERELVSADSDIIRRRPIAC
jgi:hypothetical protein